MSLKVKTNMVVKTSQDIKLNKGDKLFFKDITGRCKAVWTAKGSLNFCEEPCKCEYCLDYIVTNNIKITEPTHEKDSLVLALYRFVNKLNKFESQVTDQSVVDETYRALERLNSKLMS